MRAWLVPLSIAASLALLGSGCGKQSGQGQAVVHPPRAPAPGSPALAAPLAVGAELPVIQAAGWINGAAPDLAGKVAVVEVWAYW